MARTVGLKKAKEIWLLCRQYDAQQALQMGLVNTVVPLELLEETVQWCREMLQLSPMALRMIKAGFNADTDGLAGIQELAGNATGLFYQTAEGQEGRNAYLEKRKPDFAKVPPPPVTPVRIIAARLHPFALPLRARWRSAGGQLGNAAAGCSNLSIAKTVTAGVNAPLADAWQRGSCDRHRCTDALVRQDCHSLR